MDIHPAVGGGLEDPVELALGVVKQEQGHPLPDPGDEPLILGREPKDAGPEAALPGLAVGHEDGPRHVGGVGVFPEGAPRQLEPPHRCAGGRLDDDEVDGAWRGSARPCTGDFSVAAAAVLVEEGKKRRRRG